MPYEHGSLNLDIKNPFRVYGAIQAIGGTIISLLAIYLLAQVSTLVQADQKLQGWSSAIVGLILLMFGLKSVAIGTFRILRFFVGRSIPTSLAYNHSHSERDTAAQESNYLSYSADGLEQMLMGRKNITFVEPTGWLARIAHSIFPKLTFLPYPIRNITQRLIDGIAKTAVAVASYLIVSFVLNTGLLSTTNGQDIISKLFGLILLLYLIVVWAKVGNKFNANDGHHMNAYSSKNLGLVIALSFTLPLLLAVYINKAMNSSAAAGLTNKFQRILEASAAHVSDISFFSLFGLLVLLAALVIIPLTLLLKARSKITHPITEVSETRENWQESVHSREIFINIDNIIMANRRYKEIPNRIYRDLNPELNEQTHGKGDFSGQMIQETQPVYTPLLFDNVFKKTRLTLTIIANALLIAAAALLMKFAMHAPETFLSIKQNLQMLVDIKPKGGMQIVSGIAMIIIIITHSINLLAAFLITWAFGRIATNQCYLFWSEMTFKSMLIYFKCEGTFSESKLSTGSAIHDSTRSENVVVRSSITPWIIVSNITTSTFAGVGHRNLEYPRFILEMHSDDETLRSILADMKHFLENREAIASINNEKDLRAANNIFQINRQTRAPQDMMAQGVGVLSETSAAAYLSHEEKSI